MWVTSPSLLYAAIWLTSTAFALVLRPSNLEARADGTPQYPNGYDAKTCPFNSTMELQTSPVIVRADRWPVRVSTVSNSTMVQRNSTPAELEQICRQIGRLDFTGAMYENSLNGREFMLVTPEIRPGVYVVSLKGNMAIRGLEVDEVRLQGAQVQGQLATVKDNHADHIGVQFTATVPMHLRIIVKFWEPNTEGQLGLFKLGPESYAGPRRV